MHTMSITQIELNWLEDHFLFIRTWVLQNAQTLNSDQGLSLRPQFPIPGLTTIPADIERFLLRYYPVIHNWISTQEDRQIATNNPVKSFEDFLGKYGGGAV